MKQLKPGRTMRRMALIVGVDCLFFSLVSPSTANSSAIIIGSFLLGVSLYAIFSLVVEALGLLLSVSIVARRRLALCAAVLMTFILLLQSIGQLSWHDMFALIPFSILTYLYLGYITARRKIAQ